MVQQRLRRRLGQGGGPYALGRDHVRQRPLQRAGADVEFLGELFRRKLPTRLKNLSRRPGVVGEEDVEGVGGGHVSRPFLAPWSRSSQAILCLDASRM